MPVVYVVIPFLPRAALVEWEVLCDAAPDLGLWTCMRVCVRVLPCTPTHGLGIS